MLHMIGNTHFDPSWLWTWDEAMASIRATFKSALARMDEDADYIYSFSCPAVFEWIEEADPELFEEIRRRVREGRWDVRAEGWWLQPDCNLPSGESLVRQGLYGQRYLMEKFGVKATTVFNSDSFGHCAMMPQILKKSGIDYYVMSRPEHHERQYEDDLFTWKTPDGSSVLTYHVRSDIEGTYAQDTSSAIRKMRAESAGLTHDSAVIFGVSDHGGAPTKKSIAQIHEAMETDGDVRFSSTTDFFTAQRDKVSSEYAGELQPLFYGPFSNVSEVKRNNRQSENLLSRAERASVLAMLLNNRAYPAEKLERCWKDTLFNQFHDILGGTCTPEVYEDARSQQGRVMHTANEITVFALQSICRRIKTFGDNDKSVWNFVLFNLTGHDFKGPYGAEAQWAWEFPWYTGGLELVDENGRVIPCQISTEGSKIEGFRSRVEFEAEVPAMGWKTYALRQTGEKIEKDYSETEIRSPFRFEVYEDKGDTWCFNTTDGYGEKQESPVLAERRTVEKGTYLTKVKQVWHYRHSVFTEYVTVYPGKDISDYEYEVVWNEKHQVVKLVPEWAESARTVRCGSPAGMTERAADGKEYPVNDWLVWGGKTLLLDGVSAYDTKDTLRLTVLRSPIFGDLRIKDLDERIDYRYMEQGAHFGRIRVVNRALDNLSAAVRAEQWLNKPVLVCEANHGGDLAPSGSALTLSPGAFVSAWKRAEDGNGLILRLVEMNGGEQSISAERFGNPAFRTELSPYEIKTLRVLGDGTVTEINMLEE